MTLLEAKLRERLNKMPWPQTRRPLSMRSLVDQAVEQDLISTVTGTRLNKSISSNLVVHSAMSVTKVQAREIVDGVMDLIDEWG